MTKAERREVVADYNEFASWMRIAQHFFPSLPQWLNEMADPRNQSYITQTSHKLLNFRTLKNKAF